MADQFEKWNKHKSGETPWVNRRMDHAHRSVFIDHVLSDSIASVIEVGPGEMVEYSKIREQKNLSYHIVDVSSSFIDDAQRRFPEIRATKIPMEEMNEVHFDIDPFDIAYVASVLEHSYDIKKAIKNILSISKKFHFVFFRWTFLDDLTPFFKIKKTKDKKKSKKYYSSYFNIFMILDYIRELGTIHYADVISTSGEMRMSFTEYYEKQKREDFKYINPKDFLNKGKDNNHLYHRNGNYLMVHGASRIA